ncbi:MAG: glycine betaine ABC transporter substrate-binding protein [Planctomycetota bacterium]
MSFDPARLSEEFARLPALLSWHVLITLIAVGLALAISLPLGVLTTRRPWMRGPALGLASLVQTIPGIALLALVFSLLVLLREALPESAGFRAIGLLPTLIALTLYAVLPILRNTVTGLEGVDRDAVEAARGLGMTPGQRLRKVELPLAMPVIVAGLRTSLVWTVGVATLSTPIGQPSLGNFIFGGLQTSNLTAILVGCVASAALAIGLDLLVAAMQRGVARRKRGVLLGGLTALLALLITAASVLTFGNPRGNDADAPLVRLGTKNFNEQYILGRVMRDRLEAAGFRVELLEGLGSLNAFNALAAGEIDAYVDYSGTIWSSSMQRDPGPSRADVLAETTTWLRETHGIELLGSLGFENAYALAMPEATAERLGIRTIADLARHAGDLEIGSDIEFFNRPEWERLRDLYGLSFAGRVPMNPTLMYEAARAGDVDVITAFTTDGRIPAYDLRLLTDGRAAFPPYDAVLLLSESPAKNDPLVSALRPLIGAIDLATMQEANRLVDLEKQSPQQSADWLSQQTAR